MDMFASVPTEFSMVQDGDATSIYRNTYSSNQEMEEPCERVKSAIICMKIQKSNTAKFDGNGSDIESNINAIHGFDNNDDTLTY